MAVLNGVVEEGVELIVLALGERVELVVVTLCASKGHPEKSRRRRVYPVHDRLDAELLRVDAPFLVDLCVAVKARGDEGFEGRGLRGEEIRVEQITGELPNGELIERHVFVERVDDLVMVFLDRMWRIDAISVRVGITGDI